MKEFTVYPKKTSSSSSSSSQSTNVEKEEYLLMLKEDGSFNQYHEEEEEEEEQQQQKEDDQDKKERLHKATASSSSSTTRERMTEEEARGVFPNLKRTLEQVMNDEDAGGNGGGRSSKSWLSSTSTLLRLAFQRGTWDFVDGKLVLAADRRYNANKDTLLEGRVVLKEKPAEGAIAAETTKTTKAADTPDERRSQKQGSSSSSSSAGVGTTDNHPHEDRSNVDSDENDKQKNKGPLDTILSLSVPKSTLKIGKFCYPRHHPSFFEQPMFHPAKKATSFELQQVLGPWGQPENDPRLLLSDNFVELYRRDDLANRTWLLTTHPLESRVQKKREERRRRSNPLYYKEQLPDDDSKTLVHNLRVMEVVLFANNTFATTGRGLGDDTVVLRGKWNIIGDKRDALWMQVWRFGFGRSVSGSTYSEGRTLSHDDAKVYWGKISVRDDDDDIGGGVNAANVAGGGKNEHSNSPDAADTEQEGESTKRLEIKGAVMIGWGIEPTTVARFIMRMKEEEEDDDYDDDDFDDDDDEDEMDRKLKSIYERESGGIYINEDDDDIDWDNVFQ